MEIREPCPTYLGKQETQLTPLGKLPFDWNVTTVGREFHVDLGKMLDAEKNVGTPKPFIGNRAVQWGRVDTTDIGEIRLSPADMQRYRLQDGDLLVCEGGEVGRAAIWRDQIAECYYQKALHRLRAKRGYSHKFMAAVLEQYARTGRLQDYVTQTSIAHLPKEKFVTLPIPLPASPTEQERIVTALADADALVDSLEQMLTKKRQIKQGAMQELLTGKRRLPGFIRKWQRSPLAALLHIKHGKSQKQVECEGGDVPILATGGQIGWANQFLYDKPSVLIGRKGTIDQPRYMDTPFWSVDTLYYSEVMAPNVAKFLYYSFCLIDWMRHNEASGVPSLSAKVIESIEISHPEHEEQAAIVKVLSDMDDDLTTLKARLTKARELKQAMAQALLTGRIRLIAPEA